MFNEEAEYPICRLPVYANRMQDNNPLFIASLSYTPDDGRLPRCREA